MSWQLSLGSSRDLRVISLAISASNCVVGDLSCPFVLGGRSVKASKTEPLLLCPLFVVPEHFLSLERVVGAQQLSGTSTADRIITERLPADECTYKSILVTPSPVSLSREVPVIPSRLLFDSPRRLDKTEAFIPENPHRIPLKINRSIVTL